MMPSFQQKLQQLNRPASNFFLTIPSAWTAELISNSDIDALTIDMQHGLIDYATLIPMLQAMAGSEVLPMVRLQWNEPSLIMKVLDAGVPNLICPMINNRAEAEAFVQSCYFPPKGIRSYGPVRARLFTSDYFQQAEHIVTPFAMIETADAVKNLEAIAETPGLKGLYVGPNDLTISLQRPTRADFEDPVLLQVLEQVVAVCHKNKLIPGIYASTLPRIKIAKTLGFQFISYGDDTSMYREAIQQRTHALKEALKEQ